jgi:hypothetical protein
MDIEDTIVRRENKRAILSNDRANENNSEGLDKPKNKKTG